MSATRIEKIAVDAMGADKGPAEVLAAVALALLRGDAPGGVEVVGHPEVVPPLIKQVGLAGHPQVSFFPASEVIGAEERPIQSLKRKKDASLVRAIARVKEGACGAAVSCGNTGALMACATMSLRPLEGVFKPALVTVWPGKDTHFVVLDSGANPACKPENLVHNAILGNAYAKTVLGLARPRVGLLAMSTEEGQGTELTNATHWWLRHLGDQIHYVGLVEGSSLFDNVLDVVVTDGFTGNVILKTFQAQWGMLKQVVKAEITRHPARIAGAFLLRGAARDARQRFDIHRHGGAPLLGVQGNVLKAHGSSGREDIANTLRTASQMTRQDFTTGLASDLARANASIRQMVSEATSRLTNG